MSLSPEKYNPKQQFLEELEVQNETSQAFFIYMKGIVEILQRYDLDGESEEINKWLGDVITISNRVVDRYSEFKTDAKTENTIILETQHQAFQKEVINIMRELIEDVSSLPIPKQLKDGETLEDEVVKNINGTRAQAIHNMYKMRDRYYSNDLGQGGELVY